MWLTRGTPGPFRTGPLRVQLTNASHSLHTESARLLVAITQRNHVRAKDRDPTEQTRGGKAGKAPARLRGVDAMLRTIEQTVRDFTRRLLHLKNIQGQSSMSVVEALQWAREMQDGLHAAMRGQDTSEAKKDRSSATLLGRDRESTESSAPKG
jgi:hypothetical protein